MARSSPASPRSSGVGYAEVQRAAARLAGVVHRTPVLTSRALDAATGAEIVLKPENLQKTGSFKIRGAFNNVASLGDGAEAGVITYSSGNHGQALAYAAQRLGIPCVVFMPADAPQLKVDAVTGYGAGVLRYDRYREDREALVAAHVADSGMVVVPPYEHPATIAGQGTVADELIEDAGPLDVLLVPVGGGGLIAGCAIAARARQPGIRIVGVEPANGDDTRRSLAAGTRIPLAAVPETIADGLQAQVPGELTFGIVRRLVDEIVTVTDEQILTAMRFLFEREKVVVEPSGAATTAAALAGAVDLGGRRAGLVVSGGNVGAAQFCGLIAP